MVASGQPKLRAGIFWLAAGALPLLCLAMSYLAPIGHSAPSMALTYSLGFALLAVIHQGLPSQWTRRRQLLFILALAFICRLALLPYQAGEDVHRYVWEGRVLLAGYNPYLHAPNSPVLGHLVDSLWPAINHKEFSAIYGPLAQLLFGLLAGIWASPFFFKAVISLADLALVGVLAAMLAAWSQPPRRLALYALNPLVLLFIAGEGHLEPLQALPVCLALYCFHKQRPGWGYLCLGAAVMVKYLALVLLPFVINARHWKKSWLFLLPLAAYLPFAPAGEGLWASLGAFGSQMHYNDPLSSLLRVLAGPAVAQATPFLLVPCLLAVWLLAPARLRAAYLALGVTLLFLPTLHPWYLALVLPMLVFFPSRAWLYLCWAVVVTFAVMAGQHDSGRFQEIGWLKLPQFAPFFALALWDWWHGRRAGPWRRFDRPQSVSVVIPTLDEEASLAAALDSLKGQEGLAEVVVADGGSGDGTVALAHKHGARVVRAPRGRGGQIRAGAEASRAEVILVLHADSRLAPGCLAEVLRRLAADPAAVGGSMRMGFSAGGAFHRLIALLNNLRTRLTGIAFGDQAQFFRREALVSIGGFPAQMLMEDVELSLRLALKGRLLFLPCRVLASPRAWPPGIVAAKLWLVVRLCLRYLLRRRLELDQGQGRQYYARYYAPPQPPPATCH